MVGSLPSPSTSTPRFVNINGFDINEDFAASTWWKTIYTYTARQSAMSYYHDKYFAPAVVFTTDQGSVPRVGQLFIPKDRFLGFYIHDSIYLLGGAYINGVFVIMTRKQADDLLFEMIMNDPLPGTPLTAWTVWSAVRMFGASSWKGNK